MVNKIMIRNLSEEEMRSKPLTLKNLKETSSSAHAFWKMPLYCEECLKGLNVTVFSDGAVEINCYECKKMLGVLLLTKD
jgi:pyruvate formate-lyase activating enzyme-like uncharacterized protein